MLTNAEQTGGGHDGNGHDWDHKDLMSTPALHHRVTRLEVGQDNLTLKMHEQDTTLAVLKENLSHIRDTQDRQTKGINRVLWAVALTFISVATSFVLEGGLTAPLP